MPEQYKYLIKIYPT